MNPPLTLLAPPMTIAAVERDTRIGKDTLRVWERRYGFPQPLRDPNGERLYPADQVERLRHIKRLLDAGQRPGRVVAMSLAQLQEAQDSRAAAQLQPAPSGTSASDGSASALMELLRGHDWLAFRRQLTQSLLRQGLGRFVTDTAVPLMQTVGHEWARGQLQVFEEHLCSEALETVLRAAIASAPEASASSTPRVLSATFPGEVHGLGLLMAEAMFSVEGCCCLSLGRQIPLQDLVRASRTFDSQIIALSFTATSPAHQTVESLQDLREQLPAHIEIWAGSPLPALQRRGLPGMRVMASLTDIAPALSQWRLRQHNSHGPLDKSPEP